MKTPVRTPALWLGVVAVVGVLFGLLTLHEGGAVLFIDGASRQAAGNYVPFVLWFNFLAGFVYVVAGIGLWLQRQWAVRVAFAIAAATLLIFAAFGWHVMSGGTYELRTVVAMTLRSAVWLIIATVGWYYLLRPEPKYFSEFPPKDSP